MHDEEALLRSCYTNALELAKAHGCESIAFPLISGGIYGYPKDEALSVATGSICDWLMSNDMDVSLVMFDKTAFMLSSELLGDVKAFIDENYVDEQESLFSHKRSLRHDGSELLESPVLLWAEDLSEAESIPMSIKPLSVAEPRLSDYTKKRLSPKMIKDLDEPFSTTLLRLIDAKGKTDIEVYKRANLDRKLFSKIRKGMGYMPSKKTAVALAVALELTLPETRDLLERAGFALSRSVLFDVIVEYFISKKKYDIFEINNTLFEYDQQLLGG